MNTPSIPEHDIPEFDDLLQPTTTNPNQYFNKQGLTHAKLRDAVIKLGPIAVDHGDQLWHYNQGVWHSDGERIVRQRCSQLLGNRWRTTHTDGIVKDLKAQTPFIGSKQPSNYINTRSGLLHWKTRQLIKHTHTLATTCQIAANWNPHATCPTIDTWLQQVAPQDATNLIWEVIGTAIYAEQPTHQAIMLYGPGRNGKSTLFRLIEKLVGHQHTTSIGLQELNEQRFATAELFGKLANIAGDIDTRTLTQTDIFKKITGDDTIKAERKYGRPFTFTNTATMLFSANELPPTSDLTTGFFSRWIIVPFTNITLTPNQIDPTLEPRMHKQLDGALNKAIDGLHRVTTQGHYSIPDSVQTATDDYRRDADSVLGYTRDHLTITNNPDDRETRLAVYQHYQQWCHDNGLKPVSARKFWPRLRHAHPNINADYRSHGQRYAIGLTLNTGHHDF